MIRYLVAVIGVALISLLSACGGNAGVSGNIVGTWSGTYTDGDSATFPIVLKITQGAPNVSAKLSLADEPEIDLSGTYKDTALDLSSTDGSVGINFNATVAGSAMTGSFVIAEVANPILTGGSFNITKQ